MTMDRYRNDDDDGDDEGRSLRKYGFAMLPLLLMVSRRRRLIDLRPPPPPRRGWVGCSPVTGILVLPMFDDENGT